MVALRGAPNNGGNTQRYTYTPAGELTLKRISSLSLQALDWFSPFNSLSTAEVELYQRGEPIYAGAILNRLVSL